ERSVRRTAPVRAPRTLPLPSPRAAGARGTGRLASAARPDPALEAAPCLPPPKRPGGRRRPVLRRDGDRLRRRPRPGHPDLGRRRRPHGLGRRGHRTRRPAIRPPPRAAMSPADGGGPPRRETRFHVRLRRLAKAVARRPLWAAAAATPAVPALAVSCFGGGTQSAASLTLGAMGFSSAIAAIGLRHALRTARTAATAPAPPIRSRRPGRSVPKQRGREIEQWRHRLGNGWSATAGEALRRTAESEREHPEARVRALAALCEHHAARRGRGPARTREADIVIVSTMNLRGGTTAANAAEILAYRAAGLRVGLVHHPVLDRAMGRPVDPRIRALTDGEQVFEVRPHDTVRCDLAIARFPAALANLMEDRPRIEAARTVLLVNQTPFEQYGPTGGYGTAWSIGDVHRNTTEWLGPHTWYAIGPAVRDAMRDHHADELA